MATRKMKPIRVFVPFSRVDDEQRIVEGYAFVNETVPGEGGIRLKRSAMEAATPEYLRNGTVREMHQPSAAGRPLSVEWDAKGAKIAAKIVDDQAWEKVKEQVYRGFSVGVNALQMIGKDVEKADWWDSSLIDRGKDADAMFTLWRADGDEERECEILDEKPAAEVSRLFNDHLESLAAMDLSQDLSDAFQAFLCCCMFVSMSSPADIETNITQFADYLRNVLTGNEAENKPAPEPDKKRALLEASITRLKAPAPVDPAPAAADVARLETLEAEHTSLMERLQSSESEISRVRAALSESETALAAAKVEVKRLEALPGPSKPVVRFPEAVGLERSFPHLSQGDTVQRAALETELAQLTRSRRPEEKPLTEEEQVNAVHRVMAIKFELSRL